MNVAGPIPSTLHQLVAAGERTVLLAVLDNPPGGQLVEARNVPEQGNARRVQVDADEVDATGDDRLERLLELLGIDVVLIKPHADILGLDLDQLGQRVLEPAADRDAAAQGRVEVGKLVASDLARRVDAGAGLVDDDVGELGELRIGRVGPGRLLGRRQGHAGFVSDRDRDESDLPWPPCLGGAVGGGAGPGGGSFRLPQGTRCRAAACSRARRLPPACAAGSPGAAADASG